MKVLRYINKRLHKFWEPNMSVTAGIDSHKWESKIEILGCLSGRSHQFIEPKGANS
jgi:hypothetical protein